LITQAPNFDFTKIGQQLQEADETTSFKLLKGIHERFWHATKQEMERFLNRLQVPQRVIEQVKEVIAACADCDKYKLPPSRPRFGAELAGWFNDRVMIDLFFLFKRIWLILVDEATRYKVAEYLKNREGTTIMRAILHGWLRYFGPMKQLVSDQEGGVRSDETAITCERFSIHRVLKGSDDTGRHTGTGLAERHIQLIKLAALKTERTCVRQGLDVTYEDIVTEVTMGQNSMLEYGGYSPNQCVFGHNPRGL